MLHFLPNSYELQTVPENPEIHPLSLAVFLAFMRAVAEVLCLIPLTELSGFRFERIMAKIETVKRSDSLFPCGRCLNSSRMPYPPEKTLDKERSDLLLCPSPL